MNNKLKAFTLLITVLLLANCSIPRIFQVVISQGNLVDQEMLDKLEVGMTESQVKFVMGTPLISDTEVPKFKNKVFFYIKFFQNILLFHNPANKNSYKNSS